MPGQHQQDVAWTAASEIAPVSASPPGCVVGAVAADASGAETDEVSLVAAAAAVGAVYQGRARNAPVVADADALVVADAAVAAAAASSSAANHLRGAQQELQHHQNPVGFALAAASAAAAALFAESAVAIEMADQACHHRAAVAMMAGLVLSHDA